MSGAGSSPCLSAPPAGPVLCLGEAMVEFCEAGDGCWRRGFAGDTLNVAWALRALLAPEQAVDFVTRVGTDALSDALLARIAGAGIGTARIARDPTRTLGLYTIATDASGERSFSYWRSASAARRLADDRGALAQALSGAGLVYLSGITAAILGAAGRAVLLSVLAETDTPLAYDPNYRPALWESAAAMREFAPEITARAALVLPSFDDEAAGFGDATPAETIARLSGWGAGEIVVKNGTGPMALGLGGAVETVAVAQPVVSRDTTGAGDGFNGGYLAARLCGVGPLAAVRQGQAVAGRVVAAPGALIAPEALRAAAAGGAAQG